MKTGEHIAAVVREGGLLAAAADRAGLGAPVPACPGWAVRDLLKHLGYVHRWAAGYVGQGLREEVEEPAESTILAGGPPDAELPGWFRDGVAALARTLQAADPGLHCWTFMSAPSPLAFWARRQAHETAIHRADAEGAAGGGVGDGVTPYPAAFAADGIDELLTGFAPGGRPGGDAGEPRNLRVRATDTGDEWLVRIGAQITAHRLTAQHLTAQQAGDDAGCVLAGPASDLYLLLWNRLPLPAGQPVAVTGDAAVLDTWHGTVRVRW